MIAAMKGLHKKERHTRAKAILQDEQTVLGNNLCALDWNHALREAIPVQCKGLLVQQTSATREGKAFKDLVAARQRMVMPRYTICPVGPADVLARQTCCPQNEGVLDLHTEGGRSVNTSGI